MKVRMLVSIAGHAEPKYDLPEFSFLPGEEIELHGDLAAAWIAGGLAEVPKSKATRKSTAAVPEATGEGA